MQTDTIFSEVTVHVASVWTPSVACCCLLLCCWELLHKAWNGWTFEANNSQHFFCSMIAKAERNNVASICPLLPTWTKQLPTLLGQNSLITFKACFWQTCLGIMLYWKFEKIKPLLFKIIIILLKIIIYKINISVFNLFQILSSLLVSPYFFLDVLYVHELPSELNLCKVSSTRLILILSMNVTVKFFWLIHI